jgi:hypothetical protein
MITITGLGDHDRPDWLITMTGIRTRVLDNLQVAALSGRLDTEKHAALTCDTA